MKKIFSKSLDSQDEQKLRSLLNSLNELNKSLTAKYTLRNDLEAITDGRSAAAKLIKEEIDALRLETQQLKVQKEQLIDDLNSLSELKQNTEELKQILQQNYKPNITLLNYLKQFMTEEKITELESKASKIENLYSNFYDKSSSEQNKIDQINEIYLKADTLNKYFFEDEIEFDGLQIKREQAVKKEYEKICDFYDELFENSEDENGEEKLSISKMIKQQEIKIDHFYNKIFGSSNPEQKPLSDVLDSRLQNLKDIESEAKKIIGLSSIAGLAGGFVEKGKEARMNKYVSLGVFVLSLILLAIFNFFTINFDELDKITLTSITIRLVINIPLIWIATVANLNLNKYSKLEAEYGHKESLAKSYEKYKDEIFKLPQISSDSQEAYDNIYADLIRINLEAFKKNPADGMDTAKSNSILDQVLSKIDNKSS
ncbi:hypothetical protein ACIN5162_3646 [Acinetobacter baumannii OIFC0162]|uniref:hypothetical protein n=1 Tax=Acinetobacter calcoaceticus/baumannii complex TaxID=909768 RepID=UPI00028C9464|nr:MULTISPECIES: hypothetical protein [Acinetobacter calcoaceticus/baumannii complex]HAV4630874.1 hypothetical protein [Acinetobacter baumannii]EKK13886.1 hypothetical protein ACIN5162_3646 [Acinetobacter baumannii OIFC0162]MBK0410696.1 hypothetical protein [Acinetobacter pittii]MBK1418586.1 hypothetical protein [Acinetobacter pittii]MDX8185327.1 hypothetical protein [Acinetobacter pittii]